MSRILPIRTAVPVQVAALAAIENVGWFAGYLPRSEVGILKNSVLPP